jgi:hypothetical protein
VNGDNYGPAVGVATNGNNHQIQLNDIQPIYSQVQKPNGVGAAAANANTAANRNIIISNGQTNADSWV